MLKALGRDDLTDEIRKKNDSEGGRRPSDRPCSPKAKAPRCRRTARPERSELRAVLPVNFCPGSLSVVRWTG